MNEAVTVFEPGREPSRREAEQVAVCHQMFLDQANEFGAGGCSVDVILEALSATICDIVAAKKSPHAVAPYFETQAERAVEIVNQNLTGRKA